MHAFPQRIARWSRRRTRLLLATLWAVNVAQIVLLVVHPITAHTKACRTDGI